MLTTEVIQGWKNGKRYKNGEGVIYFMEDEILYLINLHGAKERMKLSWDELKKDWKEVKSKEDRLIDLMGDYGRWENELSGENVVDILQNANEIIDILTSEDK